MNKISLKNMHVKAVEQLSREDLKNVIGGVEAIGDIDDLAKCYCPGQKDPVCDSTGCHVAKKDGGGNHYHCGDGVWKDC